MMTGQAWQFGPYKWRQLFHNGVYISVYIMALREWLMHGLDNERNLRFVVPNTKIKDWSVTELTV